MLSGYRKLRDAFGAGCSIAPRSRLRGAIAIVCVCLSLAGCHRKASAPGAPAGALSPDVLTPYLAIQEGLANDSIDGLASNAGAVAAAAEKLGPPASRVVSDARSLGAAPDIADARQRFGALSDTLVSYTKAQRAPLPSDVREAFCPMAQKPWLQRGSKISNPYYGTEMPGCGEFK